MSNEFSTKQVGRMLGIRPTAINAAIFDGRVEPPQKNPSGRYRWDLFHVQKLSWAMLKRPYIVPSEQVEDIEK